MRQKENFTIVGVFIPVPKSRNSVFTLVPPQKLRIPLCRPMPPLVLDEGIITAQIHRHRSAADRTAWHKLAWHTHIALLLDHLTHGFLVVVGFLTARLTALEQPVIALCVEQTMLVEPGFLELMVNIGGNHKVVLVFDKRQ